MNGFEVALNGHPINIIPPQNIAGGVTSQAFSMIGAGHVSIVVKFGVVGGSPPQNPTSLVVNQCTNAAGANPNPLASFRYYYQTAGGAGNDGLNGVQNPEGTSSTPPNWTVSSSGITQFTPTLADTVIVIELEAAELETSLVDQVGTVTEYPYLQVVINNGEIATYCQVDAILSGLRRTGNNQPSFTV
jgi:hypothetical protein